MDEKERRKTIVDKWLENKDRPISMIAKDLKMPRRTVDSVIKRYHESLSIDRKPGSGRKSGPSDPILHGKLVKTIRKNRGMSQRDLAQKSGTSKWLIQKTMQREGLKSRKKKKVPRVSEKQNGTIKTRARKLYDFLGKEKQHLIVDDETYLKADFQALPGPQYYIAADGEILPDSETTVQCGKFDEKYLVWQAICECGDKSSIFVTKGTIRKEIYIKECLEKRLLPFIRKHDVSTLFWPDLAPAHYAKDTLQFLEANGVNYVPKELNPPNVPQCRPIEHYWGQLKGILRKRGQTAQNINQFRGKVNAAVKKVSKDSVKKDMEGIRKKLRVECDKRRTPRIVAQ